MRVFCSKSKFLLLFSGQTSGFGIGNDPPQLEDEVVREAEGLQVGVVDGLGKIHRVRAGLGQFPDLGS